jgi:aspartate/methionine/tyrosine aminotransferase
VLTNSTELAAWLLEEHNVAVVPGGAFGDDACQRLSYAMSMKAIEKGVDRIEAAVKSLK